MKKILKKKNKGFTLVETLVAISIFTLAILALLVVLSQSIANNNYAKKKIIASYLAQEGIEYTRNMRDTFVLFDTDPTNPSQHGWNAFNAKVAGGIYPSGITMCAQANGCYFSDLSDADYDDTATQPMAGLTVTACPGDCPALFYDSNSGRYRYTFTPDTADSGFIRKIQVTQIRADEIRIFSTVSWTQNSGDFSITFSEDLFNWVE